MWHVEVQKELDELKQEKKGIKRQLQYVDDIMKEDLYTAYYAVHEDEEIVADRMLRYRGWKKTCWLRKQRKRLLSRIQMQQ